MAVFSHYGFASVSTDTGHLSNDGSWALDQPEKIIDWGWRAMHGSVELAKEITKAYYSDEIQYSYYAGCSTGGRQGLKEIQRFPHDFDGVLAGAPAWWTNHLQPWTTWIAQQNLPETKPEHISGVPIPRHRERSQRPMRSSRRRDRQHHSRSSILRPQLRRSSLQYVELKHLNLLNCSPASDSSEALQPLHCRWQLRLSWLRPRRRSLPPHISSKPARRRLLQMVRVQ